MSQRKLFWFWLPLWASWLLMSGEGPIVSAVINRLPQEVIMLAAQGITFSLSVFIESPIINLLSTGTAMVNDRHSFLIVRKFTLQWLLILTVITIIVAFTPVFDLIVIGLLGAPDEVAVWVRPGLQLMTFWSAAIGWRRFLQGVLIRFGHTRPIAYGTFVRLVTTAVAAVGLGVWTETAGAIIGPIALMVGVAAEAIVATYSVHVLLQDEIGVGSEKAAGEPLTYNSLFWFHMPLAGTAALNFIAQPIVAASLARLSDPTNTLAAWPLILQLLFVLRASGLAVPEITIAKLNEPGGFPAIRRFVFSIALMAFLMTAAVAFTPLADWYLYQLQDANQTVGVIARRGYILFLFYPMLTVLLAWLRGILIYKRATPAVTAGMAINLISMVAILISGVILQWSGILVGAVSMITALLLEIAYLSYRTQKLLGIPLITGIPKPTTI